MGIQILRALQKLHKVGFCHWDLKLDNICYSDGFYYLIDFALAQRIQEKPNYGVKNFKGNSMFASIRKYKLYPIAGPIDDIESLLYLLCFCMDEFYLPWLNDYQNLPVTEEFIISRLVN